MNNISGRKLRTSFLFAFVSEYAVTRNENKQGRVHDKLDFMKKYGISEESKISTL